MNVYHGLSRNGSSLPSRAADIGKECAVNADGRFVGSIQACPYCRKVVSGEAGSEVFRQRLIVGLGTGVGNTGHASYLGFPSFTGYVQSDTWVVSHPRPSPLTLGKDIIVGKGDSRRVVSATWFCLHSVFSETASRSAVGSDCAASPSPAEMTESCPNWLLLLVQWNELTSPSERGDG